MVRHHGRRQTSPKRLAVVTLGSVFIHVLLFTSRSSHISKPYLEDCYINFVSPRLIDRPTRVVPIYVNNKEKITDNEVGEVGIISPLQNPELIKHNSRIPKIIHQFWDNETVPTEYVDNIRSLIRDNGPDTWQYYFWKLETARALIKKKHPEYLKTFDKLPVSRADAHRYVILYEYGGVYLDLDFVSVKPLNSFISQHTCAFVQEPDEHLVVYGVNFFLANAAMFCRPLHPFFQFMIDSVPSMLKAGCQNAYTRTGPSVVTKFYKEFSSRRKPYDLMTVVPTELFLDLYFIKMRGPQIKDRCSKWSSLNTFEKDVCETWTVRGRDARNLSEAAYLYNRWDYPNRKMAINKRHHIKNIVPHVKMYKE